MGSQGLAETEERSSEKRLQFDLQLWTSLSNLTPTPTATHTRLHEHPQLNNRLQSTLPLRLSSGSQHHHGEVSPISISSIRHRTTAYEHLRLKRNGDQHFNFVCQVEVNIAIEKRLQFQWATVHQVMPISTPTQTHLRIRKRRSSASFVERKSTSPRRSISNFDTNSTTHDWDREAAYENQRCSSWLEQYLQYSTRQLLQVYIYVPPRYRSWYSRTVCQLRRSGWLVVKTVETDNTIDYLV